jgi:hypothetical protein
MSTGRECRKLRAFLLLVFVLGLGAHFVRAQASGARTSTTKDMSDAATDAEVARLIKFVDKNGGYRDSYGGYFDSRAATYTDNKGGVLDNWEGYTYKDGSYKSKLGDYWDAPTKTFKLANGEVVKSPETSNADAITVLRQSVQETGSVEKNFIQRAMLGQIAKEHPASAASPQPQTAAEEARLMKFVDAKGGYRDRDGGYFDPRAGTYTDKFGGVVDNWQGYTYKAGSYKSKLGDYWDGPTKTFKLADGSVSPRPALSNADAIKAFRKNVEDNGGYDKDFTRNGMLGTIQREHPVGSR